MDYTGKNLDVVDVGGEVDYSGHQWFQEPPSRPEVKVMFIGWTWTDSLSAPTGCSALYTRPRRHQRERGV